MKLRRRHALLALLAICCTACSGSPTKPTATVYAAASLTAAFEALGQAFTAQHPEFAAQFVFEGSPSLVLKLQQGSRADVLATADQPNMAKVVASQVVEGSPQEFARNRLAILVATGNPKRIRSLADLTRTDLKVALCGPTVPAGQYAREALAKARVMVSSVSDEHSVTALASKVKLGELDAGIAYVTDVRRAGLEEVAIGDAHNVEASYPIALLAAGPQRAAGAQFVTFVRSEAGRAILREHGFATP